MNEKQWNLANRGQSVGGLSGVAGSDVQVTSAWAAGRGSSEVVIAFIDNGFDPGHPALQANAIPKGLEGVSFGRERNAAVDLFHGAHVAAIAVGHDTAAEFSGIAPGCSWLPIEVSLGAHHIADRITALEWLADLVKESASRYIVNLSWENLDTAEAAGSSDPALHSAVRALVDNGALVVAAAGNFPVDTDDWPRFPACYDEVITVAATDHCDRKTDFSAHGGAIDVCAPGYEILSAWGDGYRSISGSSQAAPHASAILGLIWSKNPKLENRKVRSILEASCDCIEERNPELLGKLGAGRVNAARAIESTPLS